MARIRSRDTGPELAVRRAMHAAGLRYRLHRKGLPGRPDLVLPSRRTALFVHGCFWHRHAGCPRASTPGTRQEYWLPKLARNVARDRENQAALHAAGWTVLAAWECDVARPGYIAGLVEVVRALPQARPLRAMPQPQPVRDTCVTDASGGWLPGPGLL